MNKLNILNAIGELLLADTAESKRLARELVGFLRQQEACDMIATVEAEAASRQESQPEPQYRQPTHLDIGKMVWVRDCDQELWSLRKLTGIAPIGRFVALSPDNKLVAWRQARIRVDS